MNQAPNLEKHLNFQVPFRANLSTLTIWFFSHKNDLNQFKPAPPKPKNLVFEEDTYDQHNQRVQQSDKKR